jgi:ribosomal protein S18 acetylase RimI-like enzyme
MQGFTIRPAAEVDLPRLVEVEIEAGQVFRTVGMPEVADSVPDISQLREAAAAERAWVTEVGTELAGFITAELMDGNAHVAQVSVAPDYAGLRIGKAMIELVEAWGRSAGTPATTLTTFRSVPWNAPYYARLGYTVLADDEMGPELLRAVAYEASLPGLDASLRCAMIKPNDEGSTDTDTDTDTDAEQYGLTGQSW